MRRVFQIILLVGISLFIGSSAYAQVIGGSSQSSSVSTPRDDIFDHIHTEFKKPIPYSPLRQADVIYSKRVWQIIDFREKINQPFYYPIKDHLQWKSFITVVLDAVRSGELTAYDAEVDDEFTTPMSISKVQEMIDGVAVQVEQRDLDGNIIGTTTAYEDQFSKSEVKKIRLKEVWYFDKQRSQLQVRILGLCPVWEYYTKDNQFKRKPMFWIYFPEARSVLARAEVFNRKNGAERRTYDDIFWKRMFSSYVYKEENVYDRQINQYASGMDALLESERIKNDVFEIEQHMWEY
ncbi:gliding motility protein GldN [Lentimicrobium sp. S6]|uniref:type IX secretion system ring protein PorN/GldN n=1 Tax=Lentimicrobium sp. S6 TaxID=2735872 RepID=UPI001555BDA6|nr:gliding motility protein GldN [Lentimicrobium sp. S6]NPD44445.1 gliding motility protein GldN [Lentimicrobium sp. S6]